jgi:hypothetical protein
MGKMTVAEAAQHFNVSKEAIHNRIRRGTLDCIIDHGVKYVVIGEQGVSNAGGDNRYHDYIEKENQRLKDRIAELEGETKSLRTQREEMLIAEREKVEQIYKERDEQLRNVLQVVASKILTNATMESVIQEALPAEVIEEKNDELVPLKTFLKLKQYKSKHKEKVKARFNKAAQRDSRIIVKKGKLYVNPQRYDYRDFLKK